MPDSVLRIRKILQILANGILKVSNKFYKKANCILWQILISKKAEKLFKTIELIETRCELVCYIDRK